MNKKTKVTIAVLAIYFNEKVFENLIVETG